MDRDDSKDLPLDDEVEAEVLFGQCKSADCISAAGG